MPEAPPATERRPVTEAFHGDEVVDPYRWLEDDTDEVAAWVDAQNEYADAGRDEAVADRLRPRFESLARTTDYFPVTVAGGTYFQRVEAPDEDHPVLYVRDGPGGERRELVDPNGFEEGRSMDWYVPSPDGERVVYGVAEGGQEQYDLYVVDLDGAVVDRVDDVGRAGPWTLSWFDGGFYYLATGAVGGGDQLDKEIRRREIDGAETTVPAEVPPTVWPALEATDDGRLVAAFEEMSAGTDVYAMGAADDELSLAIRGGEATFTPHLADDRVYLETTHDAANGRVLATTVDELVGSELDPDDLPVVVPERDGAILRDVAPAGGLLVVHHHRAATSELSVYDAGGDRLRDVGLPDDVSVAGVEGNDDAAEAFYELEGFDRPPSTYRLDAGSGETTALDRPDVDLGFRVAVERETYESADGTGVPAFVVHREGLDPSGDAPAVVYGYGGFRQNVTPAFRRFALPFLRAGGVFVQAVLRGGSEFGEAWHEDGMLGNKQNVFDDFYAVAEGVVADGYADPDRLAAMGRSNGGLLAATALTQRPDLWSAAVPGVPLTDMLRFHRFLLGAAWTTEYGSPEDPEAYEWLRAYSPYHNVAERAYPATLLWTAAGDTRVHPAHARKLAARLQANATGEDPVFVRTVEETGHGVGTPTEVTVRTNLDKWAFVCDQLGVDPDALDG